MNIWFQFANPSFEELFCENLDAPELECHGCCKISKINQAPDQEMDFSVPSILSGHELSIYIVSDHLHFVKYNYTVSNNINQSYLFSYFFDLFTNCFHPPEAVIA